MKTKPQLTLLVSFLFAGLTWQANAAEEAENSISPTPFVTIERGDLPIILTAPHGGASSIPDVPRRQGEGVQKFSSLSDAGTARLGVKLADAIEQRFGKRPYLVVAHFHRRYVDANRPPDLAYEVTPAEKVYDRYHNAIANARLTEFNTPADLRLKSLLCCGPTTTTRKHLAILRSCSSQPSNRSHRRLRSWSLQRLAEIE